MEDRNEPDGSTAHTERAAAGQAPSAEEEVAADEARAKMTQEEKDEVAKHEQEMNRIGAEVKGEGAIS